MMFGGDGMLSVEAFGERIRSLRIERNLTQQELAEKSFLFAQKEWSMDAWRRRPCTG